MSERNENQALIREIQIKVDKLLFADNISEEEKVATLRAALQIVGNNKNEEVIQ